MIISLYEFYDVNIIKSEPAWEELPAGFFQVDPRRFLDIEFTNGAILPGVFNIVDKAEATRPINGESFFAAFAHKE